MKISIWVKRFRDAQNPNKQPTSYNPEEEYEKGLLLPSQIAKLGESAVREFQGYPVSKGQAPNLSTKAWVKAHSDDYEIGKQLFLH